jgi:hypothetical protein
MNYIPGLGIFFVENCEASNFNFPLFDKFDLAMAFESKRRCTLLHCDTGGDWRVLTVAYGFNLMNYRVEVLIVAWIAQSVE